MADSLGARLLSLWRQLSSKPGGTWLFSRLLARQVRYTGTVKPRILELRPGYARAEMRDRPVVRNHLQSVHAVALVNIAEVVSGLAMLTALPPHLRGIVTGISIEYTKKARGTLTAESTLVLPEISEQIELALPSIVKDAAGDVVARATVRWLIGPARTRQAEPSAVAAPAHAERT